MAPAATGSRITAALQNELRRLEKTIKESGNNTEHAESLLKDIDVALKDSALECWPTVQGHNLKILMHEICPPTIEPSEEDLAEAAKQVLALPWEPATVIREEVKEIFSNNE